MTQGSDERPPHDGATDAGRQPGAPSRMDVVRAGAAADGVELAIYEPRFPVPGTRAEQRAERRVAGMFGLAFLGGAGYLVITLVWPWQFTLSGGIDHFFTPLLGICMALSLLGLGAGMVLLAKTLLPEEEAVQERHDGFSDEEDRRFTAATLIEGGASTGFPRRTLLKRVLGLTGLGVGAMAIAPLAGLVKKPGNLMFVTPWRTGVRLVRHDGTSIRPADISSGGFETVYPGVRDGTKTSDAPTMLFHLDANAVPKVKVPKGRETWHVGGFYAYSKICTHAGCPLGLWEDQTNRILCPCHQSVFDVLDHCKPVFGPAARPLPQLPITLDGGGYFVAQSDYHEPVGPSFWERG